MKTWIKTIVQVLFFIIFAKLADACVGWLHIPVPGSVFGIVLLFGLLKSKVVRLDWIELGSKWLLAEMLLFFIPAAVGIINYKSLVIHSGFPITITIIGSTIIVMVCTGLVGQWVSNRRRRGLG
jgi:holin-like protein